MLALKVKIAIITALIIGYRTPLAAQSNVFANHKPKNISHLRQITQPSFEKELIHLPQIGKQLPAFELNDVKYFNKERINQNDLKGKWSFIDFWFAGCVSCIASFPKINKINNHFDGKINYILVGLNNKYNKDIKELYSEFQQRQNLQLISAFDSVLVEKWKITSMPHILVVDPKGIVRAITNGSDLEIDKVQSLINGENPKLHDKTRQRKLFDDFSAKSLDTNLIYRSQLYKWKDEYGTYAPIDVFVNLNNPTVPIKGYHIGGASLSTLYFIAHLGLEPSSLSFKDTLYGKAYPKILLSIRDSSLFKFNPQPTYFAEGFYNYSLIVQPKKATKSYLMQIMQNDLKSNFGYNVSIERRLVDVWCLISDKREATRRLATKGGRAFSSDSTLGAGAMGFTIRNQPIKSLLSRIAFYHSNYSPPFFDDSEIKANIDITITANMLNLNEIKSSLQKNGLDLVLRKKELLVLIVNDPSE